MYVAQKYLCCRMKVKTQYKNNDDNYMYMWMHNNMNDWHQVNTEIISFT